MAAPESRDVFMPATAAESGGSARLVRALDAARGGSLAETERVLKEAAELYASEARRRHASPERLVVDLKAIFALLDGRLPSLADPPAERGASPPDRTCGVWYSRVFGWCLDAYYAAR